MGHLTFPARDPSTIPLPMAHRGVSGRPPQVGRTILQFPIYWQSWRIYGNWKQLVKNTPCVPRLSWHCSRPRIYYFDHLWFSYALNDELCSINSNMRNAGTFPEKIMYLLTIRNYSKINIIRIHCPSGGNKFRIETFGEGISLIFSEDNFFFGKHDS